MSSQRVSELASSEAHWRCFNLPSVCSLDLKITSIGHVFVLVKNSNESLRLPSLGEAFLFVSAVLNDVLQTPQHSRSNISNDTRAQAGEVHFCIDVFL